MPPACAGDHAKSKWGYLTGDVSLKMKTARWIITTLTVHFAGGVAIAISATNIAAAIPAGLMFAVFGVSYLIIEAPIIFFGQMILDRMPSRQHMISTGVAFSIFGVVCGYFLCFKEGGSRPPEYALGYGIAGGIAGLLTLFSVLMWPIGKTSGKDVHSNS